MIAVIFEAFPYAEKRNDYLDMASRMRGLVDQIDGFISVERFQSLANPDKILSISIFRDEAALNEWREKTTRQEIPKAARRLLSGFSHSRRPRDARLCHVLAPLPITGMHSFPLNRKPCPPSLALKYPHAERI
jgi:heme-degrading monooxygenase HmoA